MAQLHPFSGAEASRGRSWPKIEGQTRSK